MKPCIKVLIFFCILLAGSEANAQVNHKLKPGTNGVIPQPTFNLEKAKNNKTVNHSGNNDLGQQRKAKPSSTKKPSSKSQNGNNFGVDSARRTIRRIKH